MDVSKTACIFFNKKKHQLWVTQKSIVRCLARNNMIIYFRSNKRWPIISVLNLKSTDPWGLIIKAHSRLSAAFRTKYLKWGRSKKSWQIQAGSAFQSKAKKKKKLDEIWLEEKKPRQQGRACLSFCKQMKKKPTSKQWKLDDSLESRTPQQLAVNYAINYDVIYLIWMMLLFVHLYLFLFHFLNLLMHGNASIFYLFSSSCSLNDF